MQSSTDIALFVLIGTANAAPILARRLCPVWLDRPIDGGIRLADGHPLLGVSKTWRGLVAAAVLTTIVAIMIGWPWSLGLLVAVTAMLGDLLASFCKRRLGRPSSSSVIGLDQIPESLLPALALAPAFDLGWFDVLAVSLAFLVGERLVSPLLYRLRIRQSPY